ncbi:MAG: hypothetical protein NZM12_08815, partial [Steroidobacteraceae bacterium]|nr:hypothetical protein [Steroidobacteraceae bacterium]MDW8259668.1 hypothetical protein [Gammaproteobacteria bacterium]
WGDNERYIKTYWEKFQKRFYVAGDSAHRDQDGYFWIMGRIDDVLNVAGHRLGTMEIESALVAHPRVAEAAVVGKPHPIKGEAVCAYVVCRGPRPQGAAAEELAQELRAWVDRQLSPIARPDDIRFADNLPKTRSGKIMRRLLRAVARGEEIAQDVSTLENPAIIEQLRGSAASTTEPVRPADAAQVAPRAADKRRARAERKQAAQPAAKAKRSAPPKKRREGQRRQTPQAARKAARKAVRTRARPAARSPRVARSKSTRRRPRRGK